MFSSLLSQYSTHSDKEYSRMEMRLSVEKEGKYLNELWTQIYYPLVVDDDVMWWEAKGFLHQLLLKLKDDKLRYQIFIYLGDLFRYKNSYSSSIFYYLEAQRILPYNSLAYNQAALSYSLQDDYFTSIHNYLEAIERSNETSLKNLLLLLKQIYDLRDDLLALKIDSSYNRSLLSLLLKQFSLIMNDNNSLDLRVMNSIKRLIKKRFLRTDSQSTILKKIFIKAFLCCCPPQQKSNLLFLITILCDVDDDDDNNFISSQQKILISSIQTPLQTSISKKLKYRRKSFVIVSNQLLEKFNFSIPSLLNEKATTSTTTTLIIPISTLSYLKDNNCSFLLEWIQDETTKSTKQKVRLQRKHEIGSDFISLFFYLQKIYNIHLIVDELLPSFKGKDGIIVSKDLKNIFK